MIGRSGRPKFGNRKVSIDGQTFHSAREAKRYVYLKYRLVAGEIRDLELQPTYRIELNGKWICNVKLDFRYVEAETGKIVVEDSKAVYLRKNDHMSSLKRRLVKACHDVDVVLV